MMKNGNDKIPVQEARRYMSSTIIRIDYMRCPNCGYVQRVVGGVDTSLHGDYHICQFCGQVWKEEKETRLARFRRLIKKRIVKR